MYQASEHGVVHSRDEAWSSSIPCLFWRLDSEVPHCKISIGNGGSRGKRSGGPAGRIHGGQWPAGAIEEPNKLKK